MSPEQWRQVEAIFLAALERRPRERAAFLSEVCNGDVELRVQVEGMLTADGQSNLIDASASEVAADLLIAVNGSLQPGQTVNQYEVIRELGRGGMGQVYLAHDSKLDRPVALKLLPHTFSKDPERVRRFQQEARVVSALNHPCIITIHEIGETDGLRFIITEFVDGETLREIICSGERDLNRTLKIITQVAEALAAAHSVGIVHRDIKPENIMVRSDGYVKVLDFGLAKPTEIGLRKGDSHTSNFTTSPGLILGTVNYMSPEQARGHDVDARTDIFSLGVVLYESVTGSVPFTGKTKADMLISIAGEEPKPIVEFLPNAPARLQQIIDKSLRKNATDRYQTVAEMRGDLENLKDGLTKHSVHYKEGATEAVAVLPNSRARLAGDSVRNKVKPGFVVVMTFLVMVALAVGLYKLFLGRSQKVLFSPANLHFTKLTAQGTSDSGSISPDGKYVAYVSDRGQTNNSGALLLRQTATENTVQLVPPRPGFANWGCEFTPDENYLLCWYIERADQNNSFFERIPLIPGRTERMIDHVGSGPGFSPDGKHLAFVRVDSDDVRHLLTADLDGKNARELAHQDEHHFPFRSVAWSADGKIVAVIDLVRESGCDPCYQVTGFRIDDGKEVRLTADHWDNIRKIFWLPDNTGFLMSAKDRAGSNEGLWLVSYPGGQAQRLTDELSTFEGLSITADGKRILTAQSERPMAIWVSPVGDPTRAQKLTPIDGQYNWTTWTPDGHLIYVLGLDLWIMNADGSERKQLTFSLGGATHPDVSPDGRFVVFSSPRAGKYNIWRLELASGELKQLTNGSIEQWPLYSSDGKWIIYRSFAEGKTVFWKMPVNGGSATPIGESNLDTAMMAISPDNRLFAYQYRDIKSGKENTLIRLFDGGPVEKTWDNMSGYNHQFTSNGKGLIYGDDNNLWMQPLSGDHPKRLTNFTTEHMVWFSLSHDGQNLAFARGNWIWDIVLINVR